MRGPGERDTAATIDAALRKALPPGTSLPAVADDATFLRRVTLDLTGRLPDPENARRFAAESLSDKRTRRVEELLKSDAYAVNWARYWRDVVTYHTPASANYLRWQLFDAWWTDQLRRNRPWDQVVTALVTATGVNDETAPVNYLTALYGNPVEIAATTSRVFLGVQIQCAQCHDAKTEPWAREQFHEFAAFFGRARLIQHKDVDGRGTPYAIEPRAAGQYGMPDKKHPDRLIAMQPRFLTGESVAPDAPDPERRRALARFLTAPKNPWFARAYVNRIWTCLMGWGFYPSVNDLGSSVTPRYPEVLDALAKDWIASGYDVKWLFRTVTLTQAYQRQLQPPADDRLPAPAVCASRLRPEQVFEVLQKALGFDENDKTIPAPAASSAPAVQRHTGLRNMVYQAFKADPSLPTQEVPGTIPQALLMMNSALVHASTAAKGKTVLADLFRQGRTDDQIIAALYERVLARKPTDVERVICLRYVARVGDRHEALEDVLWSLVNSTEFLIKK
ncbi:MAG: DUF1549 domain-containing protein [Planctomycetes bacterium]|nr:DUF1549 domain-containing protein [Planctomycetota bacterium]